MLKSHWLQWEWSIYFKLSTCLNALLNMGGRKHVLKCFCWIGAYVNIYGRYPSHILAWISAVLQKKVKKATATLQNIQKAYSRLTSEKFSHGNPTSETISECCSRLLFHFERTPKDFGVGRTLGEVCTPGRRKKNLKRSPYAHNYVSTVVQRLLYNTEDV